MTALFCWQRATNKVFYTSLKEAAPILFLRPSRNRIACTLCILLGMQVFLSQAAFFSRDEATQNKAGTPIEITADGENRYEAGIAYASGNVTARYGEDVVYADKMAYNNNTKEATAYGNVRVYSRGNVYRGDQITYNFQTHKVVANNFLSAQEKFYVSGKEFLTPGPNHYRIIDGSFTTDNREHPAYHIESSTVEIYPDDRVVLKNSVIYVGDIPIMWIPYSSYSIGKNRDVFDIVAGSTGKWGPFALTSYNWQWDEKWSGALHFDYRDKRGFGGGVDLDYNKGQALRHALFRSFWTHDNGNDIDVGSPDRPLEPDARRFRFTYKHSTELTPDIFSTADINIWSDRHVTEDFFPKEFQNERVPDNYIDAMYYNPNFTVSVLGRSQINNLFETVERKPEVILEIKRQKIPYTPLSYEGESSVTNFERVFDRDDPTGRTPYRAVRYDTFHQILYPKQYWGWLSITPRAGVRATEYTSNNDPNNLNPEKEIGRVILNTGLESSFKLSKTWLDVKDDKWGIDGLRHVAQPFMNFSYIPTPGKTPNEFRGFDDRIANTKLSPLNFPENNSIDSIGRVTTLRHGIRNKLQTKRDGENVDLIDWAIYGDLNFTKGNFGTYTDTVGNDRDFIIDHIYPEIYNDLVFYPTPWLKLEIDSAAGLTDDSFNEVNSSLTWQVHPAIDLTIGNRYLTSVPFLEDSNLITFSSFYRLNENWQFAQSLAFETDDGTLQEQRYTIFRDLTAWKISATAAFRDNKNIANEFLFYLSLTLKAFPEQSISATY